MGMVDGDYDQLIEPPIDIKLEALIGMLTAIVGAVLKYTSTLHRINLTAVLGSQTKTYEQALNQNRSSSLRNL